MSTHFSGEGNIGSPPEYREFPNGNDEPRRLLRLNVYFDNPDSQEGGDFEDRGGFWAPVEIWHRDADTGRTCTRRACACWSSAAWSANPGGQRGSAARDLADQRAQRRHPAVPHRVRRPQPQSQETHRTRSPSPRPPRNRQRRRSPSAGSDPAWGRPQRPTPPCLASYPQGIAPSTSTGFRALPKIAAPGSRTAGRTPLPPAFHHVKAVAAACGLFAAAPTGARHPRSQQLR
jgi:single-strand DNA-binding protein